MLQEPGGARQGTEAAGDRAGAFNVILEPYWFFVTADGTAQTGDGTTHGARYDCDQRVPVVLFGAGVMRGEYLRAVTPAAISPTLAFLAGVTPPQPDGDALIEAIEPAAAQAPVRPPSPSAAGGAPVR
jgi:hypothetical protein